MTMKMTKKNNLDNDKVFVKQEALERSRSKGLKSREAKHLLCHLQLSRDTRKSKANVQFVFKLKGQVINDLIQFKLKPKQNKLLCFAIGELIALR